LPIRPLRMDRLLLTGCRLPMPPAGTEGFQSHPLANPGVLGPMKVEAQVIMVSPAGCSCRPRPDRRKKATRNGARARNDDGAGAASGE